MIVRLAKIVSSFMISSDLAKRIILQKTKLLDSSERIRFLDSLGCVFRGNPASLGSAPGINSPSKLTFPPKRLADPQSFVEDAGAP